MSRETTEKAIQEAVKKIKEAGVDLGELESNTELAQDGGWVNGQVIIDGRLFDVGGGWIVSQEAADGLNSECGYSYSGGDIKWRCRTYPRQCLVAFRAVLR